MKIFEEMKNEKNIENREVAYGKFAQLKAVSERVGTSMHDAIKDIHRTKIEHHSNESGYPLDDVINKMVDDREYFADIIKLSASRQSLEEIEQIKSFKVALHQIRPEFFDYNPGKFVICGVNGRTQILDKCDVPYDSKLDKTKTLDLTAKSNNITIHAAMKYTKMAGGNQDNQAGEMVSLIEKQQQFLSSNDDDDIFFVIMLDGAYYAKNDYEKMNQMKSKISNISNKILITNSNDIEHDLRQMLTGVSDTTENEDDLIFYN